MIKRSNLKYTVLSASLLLSLTAQATEIETNSAVMQAMDKVTGRVNKVTIPVKSKISFGDFSLVLRACKKRPAEETPENFAFIDVTDKSFGTEEYNIFRGWVLSSTPGISAIEHPIYDVWLLECVDSKVDETKLLSDEELNQRDALPTREAISDNKPEPVTEIVKEPLDEEPKVIHIKEFIQEDKDIEKNVNNAPSYISENPNAYVSDIEEGEEPENLLLFTKMQEVDHKAETKADATAPKQSDDLSDAIDAEINSLRQY